MIRALRTPGRSDWISVQLAGQALILTESEAREIRAALKDALAAPAAHETWPRPVTAAPQAIGALDVPPQTAPVSETGPAAFCGLVGDGEE